VKDRPNWQITLRQCIFWMTVICVALVILRKPLLYVISVSDMDDYDQRYIWSLADAPFTPILWFADIAQPPSIPEPTPHSFKVGLCAFIVVFVSGSASLIVHLMTAAWFCVAFERSYFWAFGAPLFPDTTESAQPSLICQRRMMIGVVVSYAYFLVITIVTRILWI
jgi:hypothetical protein